MRPLFEDLRYGLRLLRHSPGFTAVAVFTLAVGIAATTTVYCWMDSLVLHSLPGVPNAQQLAVLETLAPDGTHIINSHLDFRDYRDNLKLVSGVAVFRGEAMSVGTAPNQQRILGELVSGNYLALMGVQPVLGRFFSPEEYGDTPGAFPFAVISDRLWRTRYHGDPRTIGSTIRVNRHELTIIGVAPPEFRGINIVTPNDIWVPVNMAYTLGVFEEGIFKWRSDRPLNLIARLAPGTSIEQARAEVAAVAHRLAVTYPKTNEGLSATLIPFWQSQFSAYLLYGPLQILMAVCGVVLLIVCANIANLLLARAVARQKEFGIRMALGAGRGRLAIQLLVESLLLAVMGAAASIPFTLWMQESLLWIGPKTVGAPAPELAIQFNLRVLMFGAAVCLGAAIASGIAPALVSSRLNLNETLKQGGRSGMASTGSHRLRGLFVVSEIALACVALIGAGLFIRSFRNISGIDPGFDPNHVLLSRFYLPGYNPQEGKQFCLRLRERLEGSAAIQAVGYADTMPLGGGLGPWHDLTIPGYQPSPSENMKIYRSLVAPGYFDLMRIPLIEGRDLTAHDDETAASVIVVNQSFARRFFGGRNPVGRKVRVAGWASTVVGMVKDSRQYSRTEGSMPYFYMPFHQRYEEGKTIAFYIRTAGDPNEAVPILRRAVAEIDPAAGGFDTIPLADYIGGSLLAQKIAASMLTALGVIALSLAALGLYSMMAYVVSQRTPELGIRIALGAEAHHVIGIVLRQALALTAVGVAVGVFGAVLAARLVQSQLVSVSANDPLTFAATALFLGGIGVLASYLPARRATRVDPVVALRCE